MGFFKHLIESRRRSLLAERDAKAAVELANKDFEPPTPTTLGLIKAGLLKPEEFSVKRSGLFGTVKILCPRYPDRFIAVRRNRSVVKDVMYVLETFEYTWSPSSGARDVAWSVWPNADGDRKLNYINTTPKGMAEALRMVIKELELEKEAERKEGEKNRSLVLG